MYSAAVRWGDELGIGAFDESILLFSDYSLPTASNQNTRTCISSACITQITSQYQPCSLNLTYSNRYLMSTSHGLPTGNLIMVMAVGS